MTAVSLETVPARLSALILAGTAAVQLSVLLIVHLGGAGPFFACA